MPYSESDICSKLTDPYIIKVAENFVAIFQMRDDCIAVKERYIDEI
jgi:hypothetical protein